MSEMNTLRSILAILFPLFLSLGCGDSEHADRARLIITLVDNPADYTAVNVDIEQVRVHTSDGEQEEDDGRWVDIENSDIGVVNLLDYTGGTELILADTDFPVGKISQIRLVLGEDNALVVGDGAPVDLQTPSAQQSGLKLNVHETLVGGVTYIFRLDFDAARSVVKTGNGKYILKPVIRVVTDADGGAIKGMVYPATENVLVMVTDGNAEVGSSYAPQNAAAFLISGIPEGNYTVVFTPGETGDPPAPSEYAPRNLGDVEVRTGQVTDLGEVTLELVDN
jgi:hypothetical protein